MFFTTQSEVVATDCNEEAVKSKSSGSYVHEPYIRNHDATWQRCIRHQSDIACDNDNGVSLCQRGDKHVYVHARSKIAGSTENSWISHARSAAGPYIVRSG